MCCRGRAEPTGPEVCRRRAPRKQGVVGSTRGGAGGAGAGPPGARPAPDLHATGCWTCIHFVRTWCEEFDPDQARTASLHRERASHSDADSSSSLRLCRRVGCDCEPTKPVSNRLSSARSRLLGAPAGLVRGAVTATAAPGAARPDLVGSGGCLHDGDANRPCKCSVSPHGRPGRPLCGQTHRVFQQEAGPGVPGGCSWLAPSQPALPAPPSS